SSAPPPPRVVEDVRRLIDLLVTAEAPAAALALAGKHVREAADALTPFCSGPGRRSVAAGDGSDPAAMMPFDCVLGPFNPLAPPLRVRWEPPRAGGGVAFAGPRAE